MRACDSLPERVLSGAGVCLCSWIGPIGAASVAAANEEQKKEVPVAAPAPLSLPLSCVVPARVNELTLARTALLDPEEVRKGVQQLVLQGTLKEDECGVATADVLRALALRAHHEAQESRMAGAYELAAELYAELHRIVGRRGDAMRLRFGHAEVLFRLGELGFPERYCEAAPLYSEVLENGGVRRQDAAYAATACAHLLLADLRLEDTFAPSYTARAQQEAMKRYQALLTRRGADLAAVAARVAQLQLLTAQATCPKAPGSPCSEGDFRPTAGAWGRAQQALLRCLDVAATGTAPEWSALCGDELYRLRSSAHPLEAELRLQPDHRSPLIDRAPVLGAND